MYCSNCGKELVEGANFCTSCGSRSAAAERMAAIGEKAPEETGGVSAALASGRSRSRLRMTPLILLVLALALTAGVAAAAYYVYTEVYLPSVRQAAPEITSEPVGEGSDAPESESFGAPEDESFHFGTEFYEFDLPEYWRGKVVVVQDGAMSTVYAKAGYDAGYKLQLASMRIASGIGGGYGDIGWNMILDEEILPRIVIKVGATTPASALMSFNVETSAGSSEEIAFMTPEEAAEIVYPDVPKAILSDYIDLSTGGALSFEDLGNVDRQFVFANSCYARDTLPPLITLNDSPSADAIASSLLGGWFVSSDRANLEYHHIVGGVEYAYHPTGGSDGSSPGYQLVSSRRIVSIERVEGRGDGSTSDACWIAKFDDGGMYWVYDVEESSPLGVELHDHARTSVDERSAYYRVSNIDDDIAALAEASEGRSE